MYKLTIQAVKQLFEAENKEGKLFIQDGKIQVCYSNGGKCYNYKYTNLLQLCKRLKIKEESIKAVLSEYNYYNNKYMDLVSRYTAEITNMINNKAEIIAEIIDGDLWGDMTEAEAEQQYNSRLKEYKDIVTQNKRLLKEYNIY